MLQSSLRTWPKYLGNLRFCVYRARSLRNLVICSMPSRLRILQVLVFDMHFICEVVYLVQERNSAAVPVCPQPPVLSACGCGIWSPFCMPWLLRRTWCAVVGRNGSRRVDAYGSCENGVWRVCCGCVCEVGRPPGAYGCGVWFELFAMVRSGGRWNGGGAA